MICVTGLPRTLAEAGHLLSRAHEEGADLAELRLDLLESVDLPRLLRNRPLPVIVTARPISLGGGFRGSEEERRELLTEACRAGADWVDVEYPFYKPFPRHRARLILSFHDFQGVPEELEEIVERMGDIEPDLLKVAVHAKGTADVLTLVRMQRRAASPSIFLPMGPWGEPVRILYRRLGAPWTYAPLEADQATAPGQIPLRELREGFHAMEIDDQTRLFGVVGNPVAHSRGPDLFGRAFRSFGWNARYLRFPLDDANLLRELLDEFGVEGASVTAPHKAAAVDAIDGLSEDVAMIGAVNTLRRSESRWEGANTDGEAALEALEEVTGGVGGKSVLLLGAGGTASAIAHALWREGAGVTVANRTLGRAQALAGMFDFEAVPISELGSLRTDILVNTTTVGMAPEVEAMPPVGPLLRKGLVVMDAVYAPRETKLLREARAAGATVIDGMEMFQRQAERQFRFWFGRGIPPEVTEAFLRAIPRT